MGKFVDSVIAFRILHMLVVPFENTEAFRLGIIDKMGKELMKMRDLNTVEERDAYTLLHRLVFRLKRIINKVPIENKKLVSLAAAYALIKEDLAYTDLPAIATSGRSRMSGTGMRYNNATQQLDVFKSTDVEIAPKDKTDKTDNTEPAASRPKR